MSAIAYVGGRVLLADGFAEGTTVLVRDDRIADLLDESDPLPPCEIRHLDGQYLAPGFIDVQVNGGGGVLLNDDPTVEGIAAIAAAHRRRGTTGLLPTLISDDLEVISKAITAVKGAISAGIPGILGIHIEGPFLADERRGIHDSRYFRSLDTAAMDLLCEPIGGTTLVTIAPERVQPEQIAALCARGVRVALGHTDAGVHEALRAFDAGATGVTHLYNAMSQLTGRAPGLTGAALVDPRPYCSLILDGHHIDPIAARIALQCRPQDRCFLVSDAMQCVGTDAATFVLFGKEIRVVNGACRDAAGTLAGSAQDLCGCVQFAAAALGLPLARVLRMASEYPADFLGLSATRGRIAPGYRADLIALSSDLQTVTVV
jgi:N-acetylglucosamine-6-phosphate deacetylase